MKCPKCNYVSFEYLSRCGKCGSDLAPHKAELGIDFLAPANLGIAASGKDSEIEAAFAAQNEQTEVAVVEAGEESPIEESESIETESLEETASETIESLESVETSETEQTEESSDIEIDSSIEEPVAETPAEEPEPSEIEFDLSSEESDAVEAPQAQAEETGSSDGLEVGDLADSTGITFEESGDISLEETSTTYTAPQEEAPADEKLGAAAEENEEISIADMDIEVLPEQKAPEPAPSPFDDPALDDSIVLDDADLKKLNLVPEEQKDEEKEKKKKPAKEIEDDDLDINLDDLEIE